MSWADTHGLRHHVRTEHHGSLCRDSPETGSVAQGHGEGRIYRRRADPLCRTAHHRHDLASDRTGGESREGLCPRQRDARPCQHVYGEICGSRQQAQ